MKTFRADAGARFLFSLASQQRCNVSYLLGLRPINEPMSYHELQWWQAYASVRPLEADRTDILEARFVGVMAGKSPDEVMMQWFDPEKDPELRKQRIDDDLEEIRAHKAKLAAENGKTN